MSWESEELNIRNGFHFSGNWKPLSQQSSGAIPCTRPWKAWTLWKASYSLSQQLLGAWCVPSTRIEQ